MIALNFNHTVFHGAAGTTLVFQRFGQRSELERIERYAAYHRHLFATAAFAFAADAHNAITGRYCTLGLRAALAGVAGLLAAGADAAVFGGINERAGFHHWLG